MGGNTDNNLGVTLHDGGATFRVWAPFADAVYLLGDWNDWSETATPMQRNEHGIWTAEVPSVQTGQEYRYLIHRGDQRLQRKDPRALQLAGDSAVIVEPQFDWQDDGFTPSPANEQVIYELHVGTFNRSDATISGTFADADAKLDYLKELGITTIELMPCNSVWEDVWWGYTAANIYAIETAYGGRHAFQKFVQAAHKRGLAVVLDVVYNHIDHETGADLWRFDGWSENDGGGIYFYNDWRGETPWGYNRPDYGRPEVRDYIVDNAVMWLRDCHVDGLRVDSVLAMRKAAGRRSDGSGEDIAEAWQLLQRLTTETRQQNPRVLLIAEDLQGNGWITKPTNDGGAGFNTQWDPSFAACLREVFDPPQDESRDLEKIRFTLQNHPGGGTFERVIYIESHDADANGHARFNEEIAPGAADSLFARRRSALAASLLLTAPGIPMLFQGQEFLEFGAFNHWRPLDWSKREHFAGILQLYKDLIALRRNLRGQTAGLLGESLNVVFWNAEDRVIAFHRWDKGGAGDDVVVVLNLANQARTDYSVPFPRPGAWKTRFNSDWQGYSPDFTNQPTPDVHVDTDHGTVNLAPYAAVILSEDP